MEHLFPSDRQKIPYLPADPLSQEDKTGTISIHHPGYPEAHTACAVIANNAFNGFLSRSRKVDAEPFKQNLLPPGIYYFHVPHLADAQSAAVAYKWPVVSDFRSWEFPHEHVSVQWSTPNEEDSSEARSRRCTVTGQALALDSAHIIPSSESRWFLQNDMIRYSRDSGRGSEGLVSASLDDVNNRLWLRSDIHRLFDAKHLTFLPKQFAGEAYQLVVHCLTADYETTTWYHNRPLHGFCVQRELLLARFAWSLFGLGVLRRFLLSSNLRLLRYRNSEDTIVEQDLPFTQRLTMTLEKSKSTSPKKRKPGVQEESTQESEKSKTWDRFDSGFDSDTSEDLEVDRPDRLSEAARAREKNRSPSRKRRRRRSSSSSRRKRRRSNDDDEDENDDEDEDEDDDGKGSKPKRTLRRRSDFDFDLDAYGLGYLVEEPRGRKRTRYIWE